MLFSIGCCIFFSSRRRHTRCSRDWSSDVCSSDLIGTLQLRSLLLILAVSAGLIALPGVSRSFAVEQAPDVPPWLKAHIGDGEGQITQVVLQRARELYLQKVSEGAVKNPCYFAMD